MNRMLRSDEIAEKVGVQAQTIRRWAISGDFPKPRKVGRILLWNSADVEGWIEAR